jgi:hypothetical protein
MGGEAPQHPRALGNRQRHLARSAPARRAARRVMPQIARRRKRAATVGLPT